MKLLAHLSRPIVDLLDNPVGSALVVIQREQTCRRGSTSSVHHLGTITAVGGGICATICMNRRPRRSRRRCTAQRAALVNHRVRVDEPEPSWTTTPRCPAWCLGALGLRYASRLLRRRTKPPRDFSDVVTRAVSKPVRSVANRVRPPKGKGGARQGQHGYEAACVLGA